MIWVLKSYLFKNHYFYPQVCNIYSSNVKEQETLSTLYKDITFKAE